MSAVARDLINAVESSDPVERESVLRAAVAASEEDVEARAVALAMLALREPAWLSQAREAWQVVARSVDAETAFAAAAFAEALAVAGEWAELVSVVRSDARDQFFVGLDLLWRVVRRRELLAVALFCGRAFDDAISETEKLAQMLAAEGDDFLPAPIELVVEALSAQDSGDRQAANAANQLLDILVSTIDPNEWFPLSIALRLLESPWV